MFTTKPESGEKITKLGGGTWRCEDALHRAAGNL